MYMYVQSLPPAFLDCHPKVSEAYFNTISLVLSTKTIPL